jgi:hypothetical protein
LKTGKNYVSATQPALFAARFCFAGSGKAEMLQTKVLTNMLALDGVFHSFDTNR